jgi:hypothetical protein
MKLYQAIVWSPGQDVPGKRITISAESLSKASEQIEAEFGKDAVYTHYNEQDAERPHE